MNRTLDIKRVAQSLDPLVCCQAWLPEGHLRGKEWISTNPTRADARPGSFSVNVRSGRWGDFAVGSKGGDMVSLYAYLRGLTQAQAARELDSEAALQPPKDAPARNRRPHVVEVTMPVPDKAPAPNFRHPQLGEPSRVFTYRTVNGTPLMYVCRWDTPTGKEIRPLAWVGRKFDWKGPTDTQPRPLYGLERLGDPDRAVLIVEGEKAADAANELVGDRFACLAWLGGTSTVEHVKLAHLRGRRVWLWPDADAKRDQHSHEILPMRRQPGFKAMALLAERIATLAESVVLCGYTPGERPDTWDCADALEDGWTARQVVELLDGGTEIRRAAEPTRERPRPTEMPQPDFIVWTHQNDKGAPLSTIDNLRALIDGYGVSVSFNQMTHRAEVTIPWVEASAENGDLSALAHVRSLCRQNRMPVSEVGAYLLAIADSRSRHPVLEWIEVTPWDGVDRFDDLCATIPFGGDSARIAFSRLLLRKWMLSACKGLTSPRGLDFPFVLVFQGPQGRGKTRWIRRLCPLDGAVQDGIRLNVRDKDSVITATSSWISELGELDATLDASNASFKAFLTKTVDVHRKPFAETDTHAPRRTAFCGSVNPAVFLSDPTGSRRFGTVLLSNEEFDHSHCLPMQQVWAQMHDAAQSGEAHWLTADEQATLAAYNAQHTSEDMAASQFADRFMVEAAPSVWMTVTQVAELLTDHPNPSYLRGLSNAMAALGYDQQMKQGRRLWHVPRQRTAVDREAD